MDLSSYDTVFEDFLVNIALTQSQAKRIDDAVISLYELLYADFGSQPLEVYPQGSYVTGTSVKPLTSDQTGGSAGEFDVDLVAERTWGSPRASLEDIEASINNDGRYADMLLGDKKESCERLEFSDESQTEVGFHVDLVPLKSGAPTQIPLRSKDQWKDSDPKFLISWFMGAKALNPYLSAQVLIFKRMRDFSNLTGEIPSIILNALAVELYQDMGNYAADLLALLERINQKLSVSLATLTIQIPNVNEDLSSKWSEASYLRVRQHFISTYAHLKDALENEDFEMLRSIFSSDFPSAIYLPELKSLRSQGWRLALDGSLKRATITPDPEPSTLNRRARRLLLFNRRGANIKFNAEAHHLGGNEILRWQVLNARNSDEIRGDFFHAKSASHKVSGNDFENHETVQYMGLHWIRYFVIDRSTGVAKVASLKYKVKLNLRPGSHTPTIS